MKKVVSRVLLMAMLLMMLIVPAIEASACHVTSWCGCTGPWIVVSQVTPYHRILRCPECRAIWDNYG